MKKNITAYEQLERKQKAAAIATSITVGAVGALAGGMGIALAVIGGSAIMSVCGAIAAIVGLGTLACAYPLYKKIEGKKDSAESARP